MEVITDFFSNISNPEELIKWGGLIILIIIVFAETGLLIGVFLPGDSLLLTAGLLASQGYPFPDIFTLNVSLIAAAVLGDTVGYWFGNKTGSKIFVKEKSLLFDRKYLVNAHDFYGKYGGKAIIYARFLPFIRTFAPIIAGMANMNYKKFIIYNVSGGILWVASLTILGYYFGHIDFVKYNFEYVIISVFIFSGLPVVLGYFRHKNGKAKETNE